MSKKKTKITLLELVDKVINSDLPLGTRNSVALHYLLPKAGDVKAPLELPVGGVEAVDRPSREEIDIEGNPALKAEYKDTEKVMTKEE